MSKRCPTCKRLSADGRPRITFRLDRDLRAWLQMEANRQGIALAKLTEKLVIDATTMARQHAVDSPQRLQPQTETPRQNPKTNLPALKQLGDKLTVPVNGKPAQQSADRLRD